MEGGARIHFAYFGRRGKVESWPKLGVNSAYQGS
jgi:hypothetical protein